MTMLRVKGLRKTYHSGHGPHPAVQAIDFEVGEGEFYALLGPSGCGKTTTLRCIAGLEHPDGGEISIGGTVVARPEQGRHVPAHHRDIGMVFQSYAIWPHMDVFENVAYPLRMRRRLKRGELRERVMDALTLVGMDAYARRSATLLSGGQQQRVAFARALVDHPSLLLLDEPLSNLDAKLREQMREELKELVERVAITTLYVTHDMSEALAMADRIAVMDGGRIIQEGGCREVYTRPRTPFVAAFLGASNFLSGTVTRCDEQGRGVLALDGDVGRLQLALPNGSAPGQPVEVMVRREDLQLHFAEPAERDNLIAGTVERVSYQGGLCECRVRAGDAVLRATVHPSTAVAQGDPAWLRVDPRGCVVFPANGDDRGDVA